MSAAPPEHPEPEPDDVLVLQAAAAVLSSAVQMRNPWTRAELLDTAAELYRHYGVVAQVVEPSPNLTEGSTNGD